MFVSVQPVDGVGIVANVNPEPVLNWSAILQYVYLSICALFLIRLLFQIVQMLRLVRGSSRIEKDGMVICINPKIEMPFVFGNRIFLKDDSCLNSAHSEVLTHEKVHLKNQHWVDVFMCELFVVVQWFNPLAWYYARLVKQNLEFIADRGVLSKGFPLDKYIQSIICETMGAEASVLANHFRFSQNKRRLNMMKNDKKSKWRLLKLLLVLPLVGGLLWAFSEPVYKNRSEDQPTTKVKEQGEKEVFIVKGKVVGGESLSEYRNNEPVKDCPLPGTSVVLKGKTIGTIADMEGRFELEVEKGDVIVFSFVGYETVEVVPQKGKSLVAKLLKTAYHLNPSIYRDKYKGKITPPPPPPQSEAKTNKVVPPPPPPPPAESNEPVFYIVEDMPGYKGGMDNYFALLYTYIEYAKKKIDLEGTVNIQFKVDADGRISNVKAIDRVSDKEAEYAVDIVSNLIAWTPGKQRGKPVSTTLIVPVEFD